MQSTAFDFRKFLDDCPAEKPPVTPPSSPVADNDATLSVTELERYAARYLEDCECAGQSPATVKGKTDVVQKLLWYLRREKARECEGAELRRFMIYLQRGHLEPGGRWGNKKLTKQVSQRTVRYYYTYLQGLFGWFVKQGLLPASPMNLIARPADPPPPIHVLTDEQIVALLNAATRSFQPHRDVAFLLFLLDTGARVSEVCSLTVGDIDLDSRSFEVIGKGRKRRTLHIVKETAMALRHYFTYRFGSVEKRIAAEPLFLSVFEGPKQRPGVLEERVRKGLTRSGARQLIGRLGKAARIRGVRCSPHTLRHTFATKFSACDGPSTTLQVLLGHSTLYMTSRYVHLAQADIRDQHRRFSPVANLMGVSNRKRSD